MIPKAWPSIRSMARCVLPVLVGPRMALTRAGKPESRPCIGGRFVREGADCKGMRECRRRIILAQAIGGRRGRDADTKARDMPVTELRERSGAAEVPARSGSGASRGCGWFEAVDYTQGVTRGIGRRETDRDMHQDDFAKPVCYKFPKKTTESWWRTEIMLISGKWTRLASMVNENTHPLGG